MKQKETRILDYLSTLVKWRRLIIINFFAVSVLAAIFSFIIPQTYSSHSTILPPVEEGGSLGVSAFLRNLPIGGLGGFGKVSEEANLFLAIINSRTMMESAAKRFELMKRYDLKDIEKTVKELRDHITVTLNKDETITLSASAETGFFPNNKKIQEARVLSRDMANFFIAELDRMNREIKTERAKNDRLFIEKRYFQNLEDIHAAEEAMKQFGEQYGAIALPEQTEATIDILAEFKARVISKEFELDMMKNYMDPGHLDLKRARIELAELQKKYNSLKSGYDANNIDDSSVDILIPFEDMPDIGVKYTRLLREVKLQTKLLEFLLPEYEQAKIQEARNTPTVQVLDKAILPIKRTKPKRSLFVLFWGFLSLFFSITLVFMIEYWYKIEKEHPSDHQILRQMVDDIKNDITFKKKSSK
jgi:tyrosine-protein kinase Etk/Wzc